MSFPKTVRARSFEIDYLEKALELNEDMIGHF